jgi:glutaredoxin
MLNVTLFTKKNCSPCEELKTDLAALQAQYPHRLIEVDIESDSAIYEKYKHSVPVLEVGPYSIKAPISRQKLQMTLGAASDRKNQLEKLDDPVYKYKMEKGKTLTTGDRISFCSRPLS